MAILKCKMCGGNIEVVEGQSYGTCDSCGSTMTLPKVNDERIVNLFNRANHYRHQNEFDKALATYESILEEDSDNAEAYWGCVLSRYGIEYVEDARTHERIPTCHRVQNESILADLDYQKALKNAPDNHAQKLYETEAEKISEIQKGILNIARSEEPYDIFICYKESDANGRRTVDSTLAQDVYYQLTDEGYKVFFSRITLEDRLGAEYEPYIFAALNSAKVMLVIGTKPEYFNAVWVKNEWARFLTIIKKDKNKLIIPCYRDMDAYDLPDELSLFQSQDMSKIGFIQDLVRGIKKVLDKGKVQSKVTVENSETKTFQSEVILKRAFMLLEDAEWKKADELFEQVLNHEPENAMAYMGKLMIDVEANKEEKLGKSAVDLSENANYQRAVKFADESLREKLIQYRDGTLQALERERLKKIQQEKEKEHHIIEINNNKKEIMKYRIPFIIISIIMGCIPLINWGNNWAIMGYTSVGMTMLTLLGIPMFCAITLVWCCTAGWDYMSQINIDIREGKAEEAKIRSVEYKDKTIPQIKKWGTILSIISAVLLIIAATYLPSKYNKAMELYNRGDYEAALEAFDELEYYEDAIEMTQKCREIID